jgi:hypothetical protein
LRRSGSAGIQKVAQAKKWTLENGLLKGASNGGKRKPRHSQPKVAKAARLNLCMISWPENAALSIWQNFF